jgi:hypothetical protein
VIDIIFVCILNYEFPLNIFAPTHFRIPVYPASIFIPDYSRFCSVFDDKMWQRKQDRGCFVFIPNCELGICWLDVACTNKKST